MGRLYETNGLNGYTYYLYDGDALLEEYGGSQQLLRRYLHGPGVDEPLVWFEAPSLASPRFLHADHQGSITAIGDAAGALIGIHTYDSWGEPRPHNPGRFQYTGQILIGELGLYHYKARFYSPRLGRFLQVDPVGYDDQVNLYAYVRNDPINDRDPDGTQGLLDILAESWDDLKESPGRIVHDLKELARDFRSDPLGTTEQVVDSLPPNPQTAMVAVGRAGAKLGANALQGMRLSEYRQLRSQWDKGTFDTLKESFRYHYDKHGSSTFGAYLRQAANFSYRGAQRIFQSDGTVKYLRKSGEYMITNKHGKILSYGPALKRRADDIR